jgi:hypothetical protein
VALTLRVITWNFTDIQQNPRHATVSIAPSQLLTDPAGMVVVPASPETWNAYGSGSTTGGLVTTDSAGIAQTGWYYNFVISADGMPDDEFSAFLPSGSGALDLTELVQTEPVAEMAAYALASALAAETARAEAAEALRAPLASPSQTGIPLSKSYGYRLAQHLHDVVDATHCRALLAGK